MSCWGIFIRRQYQFSSLLKLHQLNIQPMCHQRGFHKTTAVKTFDVRKVELTPLEQRKLTFDSHALVKELESSGFEKRQAEVIVTALVTLTTANMDIVYRDMVTGAHQEIALQQIMAHLDAIRKDMVILEKSEFANLRSENAFTEQEKKLMEVRTEFQKMNADIESEAVETSKKIDIQVASLKTLLESVKLETIRYLAACIFTCLAIALGFYRFWK
ncbi:coiled-coil domain-containing protein 90B, mitochondrial-like isoform X3 [Sinocyclocheilus anshuiensis]|uniref:coiled-coil domain-containing protein 90B, mitochondrial-like isoform X3 n=1 Tax=Sinocyclocheilus anshuiensis TaxID=1608454 RepID=UPI0007B8DD8C|nr:PREDICTED: coiled-coil domain-containing protein 90B, mitochondrial-like isoform X3 [Sinocyclocheilus anshuiensis]